MIQSKTKLIHSGITAVVVFAIAMLCFFVLEKNGFYNGNIAILPLLLAVFSFLFSYPAAVVAKRIVRLIDDVIGNDCFIDKIVQGAIYLFSPVVIAIIIYLLGTYLGIFIGSLGLFLFIALVGGCFSVVVFVQIYITLTKRFFTNLKTKFPIKNENKEDKNDEKETL